MPADAVAPTAGGSRCGIKAERVFRANFLRNFSKRVGHGFCFAQEIELTARAADQLRQIERVSRNVQRARVGRHNRRDPVLVEPLRRHDSSAAFPSRPRRSECPPPRDSRDIVERQPVPALPRLRRLRWPDRSVSPRPLSCPSVSSTMALRPVRPGNSSCAARYTAS